MGHTPLVISFDRYIMIVSDDFQELQPPNALFGGFYLS